MDRLRIITLDITRRNMALSAVQATINEIIELRNLYQRENYFQIRYNAYYDRGWSDSYIIMYDRDKIGYGSIKGKESPSDRDTVFEFFVIPSFRKLASLAFYELLQSSRASFIECQSNDTLFTILLFEFAHRIGSDTILFEDSRASDLQIDGVLFRRRNEGDIIFEHLAEPVGDYVLELNEQVVATGGFLLHYNIPFADIFMEVHKDFRKKGLGSYLVQELKRQCYLSGRVPAARTDVGNLASRATLLKAGLEIAGYLLLGEVKRAL